MQVVATCKTGIDEFAVYDKKLEKINENFNPVEIPRFTDQEKKTFKKLFNITDDSNFDHTIGSLLLELKVMKTRYKKASQDEKNILKILKILFITQNKAKHDKFSVETLTSVFFSKNKKLGEAEFKEMLNQLRDTDDTLSFVYLYDEFGERLTSENLVGEDLTDLYLDSEFAYLDKIILEPKDIFEAAKHLKHINDKTLKHLGFNLNLALNIHINFLKTSNLTEKDFGLITQKIAAYKNIINPDIYTVNIGINIAPSYQLALEWFEKMKKEDITLDEVSYNTLIGKSPTYDLALEWFEEMKKEDIPLDKVLYSTLISKSPTYDLAIKWFEEMIKKKIKPNQVSYSTLISKSPTYDLAIKWFEEMIEKKIKLNQVSYSTLMSKSPKYEQALEWFKKMKKQKTPPNKVSYSILISKSPNTEIAISWLQEMKKQQIKPDGVTFQTFVNDFGGREEQVQEKLIDKFFFIFDLGKDFGIQEFEELRIYPSSTLLLVEAILLEAISQNEISKYKQSMEMLLKKVNNDTRCTYKIRERYEELLKQIS